MIGFLSVFAPRRRLCVWAFALTCAISTDLIVFGQGEPWQELTLERDLRLIGLRVSPEGDLVVSVPGAVYVRRSEADWERIDLPDFHFDQLYFGTNGFIFKAGPTEQQYMRSTDFGVTWETYPRPDIFYRRRPPSERERGAPFLAFAAVDSVLMIELGTLDPTFGGPPEPPVVVSRDLGVTWDTLSQPIDRLLGATGDRFWGAVDRDIIYSDDLGETWQRIPFGPEIGEGVTATSIRGFLPATNGDLYLQIHDFEGCRIYLLRDGGTVWSPLEMPDVNLCWTGLHGGNPQLYAVGSDQAYRYAPDQGWTLLETAPGEVYRLLVLPDGEVVAGTYENGVYLSSDAGETWKRYLLEPGRSEHFHARPNGSTFFSVQPAGSYRSDDGGQTWQPLTLSQTPIDFLDTPNDRLFASLFGGGIAASVDGGLSWEIIAPDLPARALGLSPSGDVLASGRSCTSLDKLKSTYRLRDGEWSLIGPEVINCNWPRKFVSVPGVGLAAIAAEGLFVSKDDGNTWTLVETNVTDVAADAAGRIYTTPSYPSPPVYTGGFVSSDGGATFTQFTDLVVSSLLGIGDGVLIGTHGSELLYWNARDSTFTEVAAFDDGRIEQLIALADGRYAARTENGRVFISPQIALNEDAAPGCCGLDAADFEAYPNPSNGTVHVRYAIPTVTRVRLDAVDLLGRTVASILDATLEPGAHEVLWNAAAHPAGVYFLRLDAGGALQIQPIVVQ